MCDHRKVYGRKKVNSTHEKGIINILCTSHLYARPLGAGDTRDIAGLKCQDLTYDVSPQCCGRAAGGGGGGVISRLIRPLLKQIV